MVTEHEAFQSLLSAESLDGDIALLLGNYPVDGGIASYRLGHPAQPVQRELQRRILSNLRKRRVADQSHQHTLIPFEPAYHTERGSHAVMFVRIADDPYLAKVLERFPTVLTSLPEFTGRIARSDAPYSFVLVGKLPTGEQVRFFKRVTAQIELTEHGPFLTQVWGSQFTAVKGAPFVFDFSFNCIQVGEYLFVLSPTNFTKLFRYGDSLRERATRVIPTLHSLISADSFESFQTAVFESKFALGRMATIERVTGGGTVSVQKFERTITDFGLTHVRVVGDGNDKRLVFDGRHMREFVKLLSDDYLRSDMTDTRYETSSKRLHSRDVATATSPPTQRQQ